MNEIDRLRELGRLVEEQAARRASVPAALIRRVRLRQAATSSVAAIILLTGAGLAWAGVLWIDRATIGQPGDRRPIAGPVSPTPTGGGEASPRTHRTDVGLASPEERAATVAIAALTAAGLHDATGIYYDYGEVVKEEDGWTAYFCLSPPAGGVCDRKTADSSMALAPDADRIVVVDASGAFTAAQRDRLVGYSESADPPPPRDVYQPVSVGGALFGEHGVTASVYWTGAIASGLRATCHVEALDDEGHVVYRGKDFEHHAPTVEGARDGVFGSELPQRVEATEARVICGEWRHP